MKLAVLIIHGIGIPDPHFADGMIAELRVRFARLIGDQAAHPEAEVVFQPVLWAPVLQGDENILWSRMKKSGPVDFHELRRFIIDFAADALAYQPIPKDRGVYDGVHAIVASAIKKVAAKTGPQAPLCVVAHSLGTVIASNYFYDLQAYPRKKLISPVVRRAMGRTPLDGGKTLRAFYTMGSPLALWTLRYNNFGSPVRVPEWLNFYDASDVIGYPLRGINKTYRRAVTADKQVNVGNLFTSWNPLAHIEYWTDNDVTVPIAESLAAVWHQANPS